MIALLLLIFWHLLICVILLLCARKCLVLSFIPYKIVLLFHCCPSPRVTCFQINCRPERISRYIIWLSSVYGEAPLCLLSRKLFDLRMEIPILKSNDQIDTLLQSVAMICYILVLNNLSSCWSVNCLSCFKLSFVLIVCPVSNFQLLSI